MAVRLLRQSLSLVAHWEELVYAEARLSAHPLGKPFLPEVRGLLKSLEGIERAQRGSWREEILAQAAVDAVDDGLDDATRELSRQLTFIDGKKTARLKRYFVREPSRYIAFGLQTQAQALAGWPSSLKKEPEGVFKALGSTIAGLLKEAAVVLQQRIDAIGATADHRARDIVGFTDDHNRVRLSIHAALTVAGSKHGLARDFADRFFRRELRESAPDQPAAAPAEEPVKG
ncbi:MAG: hypothetical protein ABTQ32_26305 [Myxococcaceae bacterium]